MSPGVVGAEQYEAIAAHARAGRALVLPALEPYEELVGLEKGVQQTLQALQGGCCYTPMHSAKLMCIAPRGSTQLG